MSRQSTTEVDGSLLIQQIKLTILISTILRYSAVSVASRKYSARNQVNPSPSASKSLGKGLSTLAKNKSVGPDYVSGEILKLGGETMIPHLARLLDITINNATIPSD
jgi:hypothetical protein